jgi:hypothetical protein
MHISKSIVFIHKDTIMNEQEIEATKDKNNETTSTISLTTPTRALDQASGIILWDAEINSA